MSSGSSSRERSTGEAASPPGRSEPALQVLNSRNHERLDGDVRQSAQPTAVQWSESRLGSHRRPREIAFVDTLPKTISGKIRRVTLRQGAGE
jgi:acyl-coenzyme A synthetase/AMP-(fatty) acid ligase